MAKNDPGYILNKFDDDDLPPAPSALAMQKSVVSNDNESKLSKEPSQKDSSASSLKAAGHFNENGYFENAKGISWPMCALYVVGDMAGGGIVSLPNAIKNTYFYGGIVMNLIICAVTTYTCIIMGRSWAILQQRWPEYRKHCRSVYAEMGNKSMGKWAKNLVLATIGINQFGICVVYLLLSAKGIAESLQIFKVEFNYAQCYLVLVLFAVLFLPVTFLKSPQDFWPLIFGAMACSILSVIFIIIGAGLDFKNCFDKDNVISQTSGVSILSGLGTIVFAYGGHSTFPTIQHDMKKPHQFDKATYLGYFICLFVYVPMAIFTNIIYGKHIQASIINSIQTVWVQQTVNLMIVFHCITAFVLVVNPLNQQVEEAFNIPQSFGWKRVLVRSIILVAITFVALSLPSFGPLLDLVGSSTTLLPALIFPVLFYHYLIASGRIRDKKLTLSKKNDKLSSDTETTGIDYEIPSLKQVWRYNDKGWLLLGLFVISLGVFICICSSLSAIYDIAYARFELPCYVKWFKDPCTKADKISAPLYCCTNLYNETKASDLTYYASASHERLCSFIPPRDAFELIPYKNKTSDYCTEAQ